MTDLPVVCSLDPAALTARREGLLAQLMQRATNHQDLADGHRFQFDPSGETLALIAGAIDAERRCCRFLRFNVVVEPDEGPVFVDVTGPSGTREFLAGLLAGT
jgi:hypothetical protein